MFKKLDSKINLALTLAIIAGISALLLALVNDITAPVIAKNTEEKTLELYSELFPKMTDYKDVDAKGDIESMLNIEKDGKQIGKICSAKGRNGYGEINALIGFDKDNKIVGVQFSNFNQTPGFGDKVKNPKYLKEQYVGDEASNVEADGASGATYSSKLVLDLTSKCAKAVEE